MSLCFRPAGHADPWLRTWLDLLAVAATGPHSDVAEPLFRAAIRPTAPGQCGSCHSVERIAANLAGLSVSLLIAVIGFAVLAALGRNFIRRK